MSRSDDGRPGLEADCEAAPPAYQPIVDLRSGIVVGFEVMAGTPGEPSKDWRVDSASADEVACLEVAIAAADALPSGAWLSVDVTTRLASADGPLRAVLADRDRPIVLELSERDRAEDYAVLRAAIAALGPDVAIAVDHAGSGAGGLPHVIELRPRYVKLDPALTHRIDSDAAQQLLVAGLRKVAAEVGSRIIAVGVETPAQRATLLSLGVELGQGSLLGRPAAAADTGAARSRTVEGANLPRWFGRR